VRTLLVDSAEVRVAADGQEQMNAKMSRAGFSQVKDGKRTEVKTEDAPEPLKRMLTESFGTPVCRVELDAAGREVKRPVVAGPGGTDLRPGAQGVGRRQDDDRPRHEVDRRDAGHEREGRDVGHVRDAAGQEVTAGR